MPHAIMGRKTTSTTRGQRRDVKANNDVKSAGGPPPSPSQANPAGGTPSSPRNTGGQAARAHHQTRRKIQTPNQGRADASKQRTAQEEEDDDKERLRGSSDTQEERRKRNMGAVLRGVRPPHIKFNLVVTSMSESEPSINKQTNKPQEMKHSFSKHQN